MNGDEVSNVCELRACDNTVSVRFHIFNVLLFKRKEEEERFTRQKMKTYNFGREKISDIDLFSYPSDIISTVIQYCPPPPYTETREAPLEKTEALESPLQIRDSWTRPL